MITGLKSMTDAILQRLGEMMGGGGILNDGNIPDTELKEHILLWDLLILAGAVPKRYAL